MPPVVKGKAAFLPFFPAYADFVESGARLAVWESKSMNQTSPVLVTYYTRAQAESLIALFSQEYLQGLGRPSGWTDESGAVESKPDVYNEL